MSLPRPFRLLAALSLAVAVAGCGYLPVPRDPIRYETSPAELSGCRRLGPVGLARTDGSGPFSFSELTTPAPYGSAATPAAPFYARGYDGEVQGRNFAIRLEALRDAALSLGATDLLLSRRFYRDWSYVEGVAFICRR